MYRLDAIENPLALAEDNEVIKENQVDIFLVDTSFKEFTDTVLLKISPEQYASKIEKIMFSKKEADKKRINSIQEG